MKRFVVHDKQRVSFIVKDEQQNIIAECDYGRFPYYLSLKAEEHAKQIQLIPEMLSLLQNIRTLENDDSRKNILKIHREAVSILINLGKK